MDTTTNLLNILLAFGTAGVIIYVRQNLLSEYYHFTTKGYLNSKENKKIIANKTDVSLFFTKQKIIKK